MRKHLLILGATALAVVALLWITRNTGDTPARDRSLDVPGNPAAQPVAFTRKAVPIARVPENVSATAPASVPRPEESGLAKPSEPVAAKDRQHLSDYLTRRSRDARSLFQAFRVSKDKSYLEEALKRFPDDPMILFQWALYASDPTPERKAVLRKMQELLPDDAVPSYLLGEQLLQEGDREGALELLFAGSLKPYANTYVSEMISDAKEFLEASGVPPDDALAQACFNVEQRLLGTTRHLASMVGDIAVESDNEETARTWAIAGSHLAQSMQSQMSQYLVEELGSMSVEKGFLSLLPPETELVAGGTTAAQRTKEIEERYALVRSFPLMSDAALLLPPAEKQTFFEKVLEVGELEALIWLNSRDKDKDGTPDN